MPVGALKRVGKLLCAAQGVRCTARRRPQATVDSSTIAHRTRSIAACLPSLEARRAASPEPALPVRATCRGFLRSRGSSPSTSQTVERAILILAGEKSPSEMGRRECTTCSNALRVVAASSGPDTRSERSKGLYVSSLVDLGNCLSLSYALLKYTTIIRIG